MCICFLLIKENVEFCLRNVVRATFWQSKIVIVIQYTPLSHRPTEGQNFVWGHPHALFFAWGAPHANFLAWGFVWGGCAWVCDTGVSI